MIRAIPSHWSGPIRTDYSLLAVLGGLRAGTRNDIPKNPFAEENEFEVSHEPWSSDSPACREACVDQRNLEFSRDPACSPDKASRQGEIDQSRVLSIAAGVCNPQDFRFPLSKNCDCTAGFGEQLTDPHEQTAR
jgi:hypothetical protein